MADRRAISDEDPIGFPLAEESDFEDRRDSLVGKIASHIARGIVDGSLPPGADLNSVELAARFGTSRTPVREALMLLEKEGLVEVPPRRRPRVARITFQEVQEIYEVRAHLNALMIERFVAHAPNEALGTARAVLDSMRQAAADGAADLFFAERMRLHDVWADHCGNDTLRRLLASWRARLSLRRLGAARPEHIERSFLDHQRLLIACEERDGALASSLIRSMTLMGLEAIRRTGWAPAADELSHTR